jgi:hypothetical protein
MSSAQIPFVVLLSIHEMDGVYLGPLIKMLEGKLEFEKGK